MDSHPLLPDSIMHYNAGPFIIDKSSTTDTFNKYDRWAIDGIDATSDGRDPPVAINHVDILQYIVVQETVWKRVREFIELAMQHATKDLIGYWMNCPDKSAVMHLLCSRTAYAIMLAPTADPTFPELFTYDQLGRMDSELYEMIKSRKREKHKEETDSPYVGTVYMLDFLPKHLIIVRARFPKVRIVGITTPRRESQDDREIEAILKARQRMAAEKLAQEK